MENYLIKYALDSASAVPADDERIATEEECESVTLVKDILSPVINPQDVSHKQTGSYLAVLYKNNVRKWICRIYLYSAQKALILPDENKKEIKRPISCVADIQNYASEITASARRYTAPQKPKNIECLHTKWGTYEMPHPYTIQLKKGPRKDLRKISAD